MCVVVCHTERIVGRRPRASLKRAVRTSSVSTERLFVFALCGIYIKEGTYIHWMCKFIAHDNITISFIFMKGDFS